MRDRKEKEREAKPLRQETKLTESKSWIDKKEESRRRRTREEIVAFPQT